jgi:hypothetical protein
MNHHPTTPSPLANARAASETPPSSPAPHCLSVNRCKPPNTYYQLLTAINTCYHVFTHRVCLKNRNSSAARDFDRAQLSPASRWPQRAVRNGPTKRTGKRPVAGQFPFFRQTLKIECSKNGNSTQFNSIQPNSTQFNHPAPPSLLVTLMSQKCHITKIQNHLCPN